MTDGQEAFLSEVDRGYPNFWKFHLRETVREWMPTRDDSEKLSHGAFISRPHQSASSG